MESGIDLLSFGATKNGALAAELLLVFDTAEGPRLGKARAPLVEAALPAAQLLAYLEDDLWLRLQPTPIPKRNA